MRIAAGLLALLLATAAAAGAAELRGLEVQVGAESVRVGLQLSDAFTPELLERIHSGLPTGFVFHLDLLRDRKRWWDDKVRSATLEVAAMYNAVADEYLVNTKLDGKLVESRLARSREDLETAMTRFSSVPVFPVSRLRRGERYLVKARALLGQRTLLSLVPVQVTTDWVESRKFRVTEPGAR